MAPFAPEREYFSQPPCHICPLLKISVSIGRPKDMAEKGMTYQFSRRQLPLTLE
jgi:hypothetical protein